MPRTCSLVRWLSVLLLAMGARIGRARGPARRVRRRQAARPATADFFVSPKGDDRWSGRLADPGDGDGPFATIARAREAVRALRKSQKEPRTVRVVLRGGTYYLDQPLEFGPEDSGTEEAPVVYAAAAGEKVVLSGGRRLTGGRWGEANGRKAWIVDIPEVKEGKWKFRQLFVNGARRPRTRLPKQGEYRIESLPGYTGDFLRSPTKQFVYAPGHIVPTWRNLRDVEVVGITRWLDNRLPIESVNGETRTVTFDRPSLFALVSSAPWGDSTTTPSVYWVENVFEALDTAGQWYLDRPQGRLYYLPQPGEDTASAEIIAPRLTQVVRVVGRPGAPAHDLRFEGITFSHTEWQPPADYASSLQAGVEVPGALFFDYAERCAVTGGAHRTHRQLRRRGGRRLRGHRDLAQPDHGYRRGGNPDRPLLLVGDGRLWPVDRAGTPAQGRHAQGPAQPADHRGRQRDRPLRAVHPGSGGRVRGRQCRQQDHSQPHLRLVPLRHLRGLGPGLWATARPRAMSSSTITFTTSAKACSAIWPGSTPAARPARRIRYNVVHDVSRRDYGGWGIYPDQGSHDLLIQKNLVYRCQDGALFAHHNRNITAENNIFAFSRQAQIERYGIGGFELTCRRNLIYYQEGNAMGASGIENSGTRRVRVRPQPLLECLGQPVLFGDKTFAQWQAAGQDKDSLIADPLFVDPEKGDFRLQPGSPAAKIGFEPWDLTAVGPRPQAAASKQ